MGQAKLRGSFELRQTIAVERDKILFDSHIERRGGEKDKDLDKRWSEMLRVEPAATYSLMFKLVDKYARKLTAVAKAKKAEEKAAKLASLKIEKGSKHESASSPIVS